MADKQDIEMNAFPVVTGAKYVYVEKADNSQGKMEINNLPHPKTGGGYVEGNLKNEKWYRIAIGHPGNRPSSGIFNIGNMYNNASPRSILLYIHADGYSGSSTIAKIASSPNLPVGKARVLFGQLESYLDIYCCLTGVNLYYISASSLVGFRLQVPEEVSADIPEGYSVKEVSF